MTQEAYNQLKVNIYYTNYKDYLYNVWFDELMVQMLIIKEEGDYYNSGILFLIKRLRDDTKNEKINFEIGLRELKHFTDLLRDLEIIDAKINYITDYIYIINSIKDITYMIDNRMDIKLFSRYQKLSKLKSNIIHNL